MNSSTQCFKLVQNIPFKVLKHYSGKVEPENQRYIPEAKIECEHSVLDI